MTNKVYADKSGSHSSIARERNDKIKEVIANLNLDPKSSREKYIAKKIAVTYFGYPLIDYTKY
jgi:hypothetical protein|tara:strand:- start:18 stop:206 length:189 start_codon:yes stop_codon:yes gene_type:complete